MRRSKLKNFIFTITIAILLIFLKLTGWLEIKSIIICGIVTILALFIDRFFKEERNYYLSLFFVIGILLFVMSFQSLFR